MVNMVGVKGLGTKRAATALGVSPSHLRELEKRGELGDIPRDGLDRRVFSLELIEKWKREGLPGSNIPPKPRIELALDAAPPKTTAVVERRFGSSDLAEGRVIPFREKRPLTDREYQSGDYAVQRARDELELKKIERESRRLDRELDGNDNGDGSGGGMLALVMQQQTALMTKLMDLQGNRQDETTRVLEMLTTLKGVFAPVDLSTRPEGKLFEKLSSAMLEKIIERGTSDVGGDEGVLQTILRALPDVMNFLSARTAAGRPGVTVAAGPAAPLLPGNEINEEREVEMITDVFDCAYRAYMSELTVPQALMMFQSMFGDTVHPIAARMIGGPWDVIVLSARMYHPELFKLMQGPKSKLWFEQLLEGLRQAMQNQTH